MGDETFRYTPELVRLLENNYHHIGQFIEWEDKRGTTHRADDWEECLQFKVDFDRACKRFNIRLGGEPIPKEDIINMSEYLNGRIK